MSEEMKAAIKKWENENMFLAAVLQEECLNYQHYIDEVMLCIETERKSADLRSE